jgi:hypothetical protein
MQQVGDMQMDKLCVNSWEDTYEKYYNDLNYDRYDEYDDDDIDEDEEGTIFDEY